MINPTNGWDFACLAVIVLSFVVIYRGWPWRSKDDEEDDD